MANVSANPTKVIIPCRISFANIWEPHSINGSEEKYSVSCVIPKSDKKTLAKIQKAVEAAKEDGRPAAGMARSRLTSSSLCVTVISTVRTMRPIWTASS